MAKSKVRLFLKTALFLLLIIQAPFIYEVLESFWLSSYLESLPEEDRPESPFADVKGVIHIHSAAGGHSRGTYPEIIEAGEKTGMKWIFLTEHPREPRIFNKISSREPLMIYGWEDPGYGSGRQLRDDGSTFRIFSEFDGDSVPEDAGGIEIFNLAESAEAHNNLYSWISWIYHQFTKPEMFFFQIWEINRDRFAVWDSATEKQHLTATAGNDAHQNLGLILETGTGDQLLTIQVDSYETSMNSVSNHLLLPRDEPLTEAAVINALRKGASYICFDGLGDPEGFSFHAENSGGNFAPGSTVPPGSNLRVTAPFPVHFRILRSGEIFKELEGRDFTVPVSIPGPYRVEVTFIDPPYMLKGKPWIISNPVYVTASS